MDGEHLRVHLPTLRTDQRPTSFYKTAETCDGLPEGTGLEDHRLPGRSADNESIVSGTSITSEPDSFAPGVAGLYHQQGKIPAYTLPADTVPGVSGGLGVHEAISTRGQGATDHSDVPGSSVTAEGVTQVSLATPGEDVCYVLSSAPGTTMVPQSPATEDPGTQTVVIVRQPGVPRPSLQSGVDVVEYSTTPVEWQRCPPQGTGYDYRHRCFPDRLGGSLQRCVHRGSVVPRGEGVPYQLSGIPGRVLCSTILYKGQEEHSCSPQDGQQHSPFLCEQDGGDTLSKLNGGSPSSMAVVPAEGHNSVGGVPTRNKELGGRQGISPGADISRMEAR